MRYEIYLSATMMFLFSTSAVKTHSLYSIDIVLINDRTTNKMFQYIKLSFFTLPTNVGKVPPPRSSHEQSVKKSQKAVVRTFRQAQISKIAKNQI
jgi:hypothetical protein